MINGPFVPNPAWESTTFHFQQLTGVVFHLHGNQFWFWAARPGDCCSMVCWYLCMLIEFPSMHCRLPILVRVGWWSYCGWFAMGGVVPGKMSVHPGRIVLILASLCLCEYSPVAILNLEGFQIIHIYITAYSPC